MNGDWLDVYGFGTVKLSSIIAVGRTYISSNKYRPEYIIYLCGGTTVNVCSADQSFTKADFLKMIGCESK